MKLTFIFSTLIAVALTYAPLSRAQETEAPTSESSPSPDESTSTSAESSPSASPASTSKHYPTPGSGASETPTPAAKASASASAKSSASPAAGAKQANLSATPIVLKGTAEQQIRQVEDAYETATQAHNIALVEPFIADDFVLTDSKGRVMNRRGAIAEFKKDTDTYTTAKNTEMKFHKVDKDVYVVTGIAHEAGKDKSGKAFDRRFRFTDTVVNRNGKWLVVATHASALTSK